MDWMQVLTIVVSTVGSTYGFYMITERRMNRIEERFDNKFLAQDEKWESRFASIDEKWERLFEKLLIQEKAKGQ